MQTNDNKTPVARQQFDGVNALLAAANCKSNETPNFGGTYQSNTPNDTSLQTPYDDHPKASASKKGAAAVDLLKDTAKGSAAGHGGGYISRALTQSESRDALGAHSTLLHGLNPQVRVHPRVLPIELDENRDGDDSDNDNDSANSTPRQKAVNVEFDFTNCDAIQLSTARQALVNRQDLVTMVPMERAAVLHNPTHFYCYWNVILQLLAHTSGINNYLLNTDFMSELNEDTFKECGVLTIGLHYILRRMHSGVRDSIDIGDSRGEGQVSFKDTVQSCTRAFPDGHQDATEAWLFLISLVHSSMANSSDKSQISAILCGKLSSTTTCPLDGCRHINETLDPCWGLQVEIPDKATNLDDCLEGFFRTETLDPDNMVECDKCRTRVQSTKLLKYVPPSIVSITVKRFTGSVGGSKNNAVLAIPQTIDMTRYLPSNNTDTDNSDQESVSDNSDQEFELYGVINHIGTKTKGHYYLYINISGIWCEYNDNICTELNDVSRVTTNNEHAYMLLYCRRTEKDSLVSQPNPRPFVSIPSRQLRTCRKPRARDGSNTTAKRNTRKKAPTKAAAAVSKATKKSASVSPTKKAASSNTTTKRKRKKAPTKVSKSKTREIKITFRSEPRRDVNRLKVCMVITNNIECKRQAAGKPLYNKVYTCKSCRKKRDVHSLAKKLYGQPRVSTAPRKRKVPDESDHTQPEPTKRQKKIIEQASMAKATANDTLTIGIEDFLTGSFPPNMIVMKEDKRRMGKSQYYCRVNHCRCQGVKPLPGLCHSHFTQVEEHRMRLKLDEVFQFPEDFDDQINKIDAKIYDPHPTSYSYQYLRNDGYAACVSGEPEGPTTKLKADAAFTRQCIHKLLNIDNHLDFSVLFPVEDYLGKRAKEAHGVNNAPSVRTFFGELAFWLFNKYFDACKADKDLEQHLRTVLQCLQNPSSLVQLWAGYDSFVPQDVNCDDIVFHMCNQFKCLHALFNSDGNVRSTFSSTGGFDYYIDQRKKIETASIDAILRAFPHDVARWSQVEGSSWTNREGDVKAFTEWLELQRNMLCCDNDEDELMRLESEWNRLEASTIAMIDTDRQDARTHRQRNGGFHPAITHVDDCVTINSPVPDYETYMNKIIGGELKQKQQQFSDAIDKLKQTNFYKVLKDAQQRNGGETPRVSLQQLKVAYNNEPNPWFKQMYTGLPWTAFACLSNHTYIKGRKTRKYYIGTIYRRFLVRLTGDCMMKGCRRKPSDQEQAAALFGFHLHHLNKGTSIHSLLWNIEEMSVEAKKNCVVFCNLCHNHKEQEDVHSIPLNKLQNQLIYPTSREHVCGRQLVIDFDLVVVILKLFVLGGWQKGDVHQCTPNAVRTVFYDHF